MSCSACSGVRISLSSDNLMESKKNSSDLAILRRVESLRMALPDKYAISLTLIPLCVVSRLRYEVSQGAGNPLTACLSPEYDR